MLDLFLFNLHYNHFHLSLFYFFNSFSFPGLLFWLSSMSFIKFPVEFIPLWAPWNLGFISKIFFFFFHIFLEFSQLSSHFFLGLFVILWVWDRGLFLFGFFVFKFYTSSWFFLCLNVCSRVSSVCVRKWVYLDIKQPKKRTAWNVCLLIPSI